MSATDSDSAARPLRLPSKSAVTTGLFGSEAAAGAVAPLPRWLYLAAGVVGAAIHFLRLSPTDRGVWWAEDATVFYVDALLRPWAALTLPYEGYYPGLPRLIAGTIVPWAPPGAAPQLFALAVAAVVGALSVAVVAAARQRVGGFAAPAVLWITMVALPVGAGESLGNLANLHWYLFAAAVWVLLARWTSRAGAVAAIAVVSAAILSAGAWPLLLPLVGLRLWLAWDHHGRQLAACAGLATLLQAGLTLAAPALGAARSESNLESIPTLVELATYYAWRVVTPGLTGPTPVSAGIDSLPVVTVTLVAVLGTAGLLLVAGRLGTGWLAAALLTWSFALHALLWTLSRFPLLWPTELTVVSRYAVAPTILYVSVVAVALAPLRRRLPARAAFAAGAAAVAWFAAMAAASFGAWQVRDAALPHADQVAQAQDICREVPSDSQIIFGAAPDGWEFAIPCSRLPAG